MLGPVARRHGYTGSAPTWRKSNPAGDWVVVNVQSSSGSTSESLRCVVNIAAAPEPWLRWRRHQFGRGTPKTITDSMGMYRDRLHPTGAPEGVDSWWVVTDQASATDAVTDMVERMNDAGWALLDTLLSREGIMESLRRGDMGYVKRNHHEAYFARAEALLRMDDGRSGARESSLSSALENVMPTQREDPEFDEWVRAQTRE
ncbi:DUF4304 domain-containing protein [Agromyces cerinus]|uniref:DUF4304 domain-containing protein n=1 Tax=Agromyces cerinus TaxID=33878 RepID=UPI0027DE0553|nr:DUF4304 domain-containing protein [Agromyces cerinus]